MDPFQFSLTNKNESLIKEIELLHKVEENTHEKSARNIRIRND